MKIRLTIFTGCMAALLLTLAVSGTEAAGGRAGGNGQARNTRLQDGSCNQPAGAARGNAGFSSGTAATGGIRPLDGTGRGFGDGTNPRPLDGTGFGRTAVRK